MADAIILVRHVEYINTAIKLDALSSAKVSFCYAAYTASNRVDGKARWNFLDLAR